jgi:hypothetical protein
MSSAPPPHLDDETLSGLLDGEPEPAGAHLAGCADCRARQELLAEARLLVAAPTSGELDELTRRRLLSAALAAAPAPVTAARPRWYRQPVMVGGIAAAVAAIVLAVPVINALNDGGRDEDASTAAPALSAEAPAAEGERSFLPSDLGDLGEISESVLRQQFSSAAVDATTMSDAAQGAPKAAQPAPPPQAPTPTAGDAGAGAEASREETAASGSDTYDNRVGGAEPCVNAVLAGPAQGGQLRATATGTLRGTPVTVLVVDTDEGTKAFVAAREGCQVLETYTL